MAATLRPVMGWVFGLGLVVTGTSCIGPQSTESGTDPLGTLGQALSSVGGEIVDDTEIRYVDGAGVIGLGGLEIEMPILAELDYYVDDFNLTVPPSWPTLRIAELLSVVDPSTAPNIGVALFAQTRMVTDESSRRGLLDVSAEVGRHADSDVIHESETVASDGAVTCWTEVRFGSPRAGLPSSHYATVLFAGPGLASSIIWAPGGVFAEIPQVVGDLVESVCGARPDGL